MKRKDRFDYILIETTGMADPAPVAQTFFMVRLLAARIRDTWTHTLVKGKHLLLSAAIE